MADVITALHLFEAGKVKQAVAAWQACPLVERQAASEADNARTLPLVAHSMLATVAKRCKRTLDTFQAGGVEPDDVCNVGVWAEGKAGLLDRAGFPDLADKARDAALPLLEAAAQY